MFKYGWLLIVIVWGCSASLDEVPDLTRGSVAVTTEIEAGPSILTSTPPASPVSNRGTSLPSLASQAWKLWEARGARPLMDSAAANLDFANELRSQVEVALQDQLGLSTVEADADWLLEIRVLHYGLDVDNWQAPSSFFLEGRIEILQSGSERAVWKSDLVAAHDPGSFFSPGVAIGNVMSAQELSGLNRSGLENYLRELAALTAEEVAFQLGSGERIR